MMLIRYSAHYLREGQWDRYLDALNRACEHPALKGSPGLQACVHTCKAMGLAARGEHESALEEALFGAGDGNLDHGADPDNEMFVIKLDTTGRMVWVLKFGENNGDLISNAMADDRYLYAVGPERRVPCQDSGIRGPGTRSW